MRGTFLASKRFWLALATGAIIIAAAVLWPTAPRQIITLPNGDKLEFAGTTYSTNIVPPSLIYRVAENMPKAMADLIRKHVWAQMPRFDEPMMQYQTPQLLVWFRRLGTNAQANGLKPVITRLADQAGVEAGGGSHFVVWHEWTGAQFALIPRRSRVIECVLYSHANESGGTNVIGRITFPNPVCGRFPDWPAETLPATKSAGDLEVRLDNFVILDPTATTPRVALMRGPRGSVITLDLTTNIIAGDGGGSWLGGKPRGVGQAADTAFRISFSPANETNDAWVLQNYDLSDATGNIIHHEPFPLLGWTIGGSQIQNRAGLATFTESVTGTLWPDESAWRLKLELKRAVGYDPTGIVTFKHVPVPPAGTNCPLGVTNMVGGVRVVLTKFERGSQIMRLGEGGVAVLSNDIRVELPGNRGGMALDVLEVTADDGTPVRGLLYGSESNYAIDWTTLPANATNLNITLLVQKTRTVEFYVKPPKAGTNQDGNKSGPGGGFGLRSSSGGFACNHDRHLLT